MRHPTSAKPSNPFIVNPREKLALLGFPGSPYVLLCRYLSVEVQYLEAPVDCLEIYTREQVRRVVVAGYNEAVVGQSDLASFCFARAVLPRVGPQLEMSGQVLRILLTEIVEEYSLVLLITVPPFVL